MSTVVTIFFAAAAGAIALLLAGIADHLADIHGTLLDIESLLEDEDEDAL